MNLTVKKISVGNIPVHLFTTESLHMTVSKVVSGNKKSLILHSNAHLVQMANTTDKWLIDYFNNDVDYVMCDGAGIKLMAKFTGQPLPEKIAYNVWFWDFVKFCEQSNISLYLLGATDAVAKTAAQRLKTHAPNLRVGYHHGYFNKECNSAGTHEVIDKINEFKPNVLLVALGMPLQEKWLKENSQHINANIFMTGGGALDFFAGKFKVAPVIVSKLYMEWLYRLLQEPKRLWKRYLFGNIKFLYYSLCMKK
jgi:N-acetylglucosaminyldiphosphoundecaprenol N-acetyl-beta-D-mannosaminyltransferase